MDLPFFSNAESKEAPLQLHFKRKHEARHFIIAGDSGSGKDQILKQMLYYIEAVGDVAVLPDPKCEYTTEFYKPERGDWVLHPHLPTCPFWDLGQEVEGPADSLTISRAIYPQHPNNPHAQFFDDGAAQVSAFLLERYRPDCRQYASWLDNDAAIDVRVKGTRLERTLSKNAAGQRSAILQTMNSAAIPFGLMPENDGKRRIFTTRDWIRQRRGWIFLPNPYETRDAMVPLISMWIDLLMLRAMSMGRQRRLPKIWFILNEVDSLNTLPQLQTGMTEMRYAGHPLVLAFQNGAQLEDRYGKKAQTIWSQAYTKFLLATSEVNSAKYLSDLIGEIEIQQMRESYSHSRLGWSRTVSVHTERKPLVSPSELKGLPDLDVMVLQRGKAVRCTLPYLEPILRRPEMVPQPPPPQPVALPPPATIKLPSDQPPLWPEPEMEKSWLAQTLEENAP